jgi:hypothetical protein
MVGLKRTREVIENAGHRVSTGLVAVVVALFAVVLAAVGLGVALCRN